jgi:hypothetical protein
MPPETNALLDLAHPSSIAPLSHLFLTQLIVSNRFFCRASGVRGLSTAAALANSKAASIKNVAVPGLKNGMDYARLGDSDLIVSKICMGTMTFGEVRLNVVSWEGAKFGFESILTGVSLDFPFY